MRISEAWLREWIGPSCSLEALCHSLTMAGLEVEHCDSASHIIDINITPNRGDCLSIQGVARDLAACLQASYTIPFDIPIEENIQNDSKLTIIVEAQADCPRYTGRVISDINIHAPTPDWMKDRLIASGLGLNNCIVDILNYVMLELGQPMHAFDLDKIDGDIKVRKAHEGEKLLTLDNQCLTLNLNHCVITDNKNVLALAGVMGGLDSAVSMQTQSVFLESAFFRPLTISGVARKFGIQTDSAFRFERGVDFNLPRLALNRATQLILQIAGGKAHAVIEKTQADYLPKVPVISVRHKKITQLLGQVISPEKIIKILKSLGCEVADCDGGWEVTPPSYRFDLFIEEDLIEEIIRVIGYDKLEPVLPVITMNSNIAPIDQRVPLARFKRALVDMGYTEAITYSFVSPVVQKLLTTDQSLPLMNPISNEMSVMRTSLWPGLIGALQYNQARNQSPIQLFESGLRFREGARQWLQEPVLSGILGGMPKAHWKNKSKLFDFYDLKGHIESLFQLTHPDWDHLTWHACSDSALHPGQSAELRYKTKPLGVMGLLHPKVIQALSLEGPVFVFELLLDGLSEKEGFHLGLPSKYPSMSRDLSFTVNRDQPVGELVSFIKENIPNILQNITVFDIYMGKGIAPEQKSVAIGLTFQHKERTLIEDEIENLMKKLVGELKLKFNAQLRE